MQVSRIFCLLPFSAEKNASVSSTLLIFQFRIKYATDIKWLITTVSNAMYVYVLSRPIKFICYRSQL
jgi:hypothetical protein